MTIKQLDELTERCDTDIRRLSDELERKLAECDQIRAHLRSAILNRRTWANHPDREKKA